jgi:hypothetical protein
VTIDWTLLGLAVVFAMVGVCLIRDAWEAW